MLERRLLRRARAVLKKNRGATDTLIGCRRAFALTPRADRLFLRAMNEAFAHHFLNCPEYRLRCLQLGVLPGDIRQLEDLPRIPYLFVDVFKYHPLLSVPPERVERTLTSSGTTGQRSSIHLDRRSLRRIRKIVHHIYRDLGMTRRERTNYLCFTYDPAVARDLGTAFSDQLLTGLTRTAEVVYAFRWTGAQWRLEREACWEALERFQKSGRPVRILGFPAHAWEVLSQCIGERRRTFCFGERSYVLTGGGWKTLRDREIPKDRFRSCVARWLGIPRQNVRDLYGLVEHGVPYTECPRGVFHVPRYSRVYVRSPRTLELLSPGERGILHLLTPYLSSFPAISLLTADVGRLGECSCTLRSPALFLEGRGGVTRHRGCAVAALDLLKPPGAAPVGGEAGRGRTP